MDEICLIIPNSGAKFEEKLIFCFKNGQNFVNFDPSTKKCKRFALSLVPFMQNIQHLILTSTEELYFMKIKSHAKLEEKRTCGLENDMRNLANFHEKLESVKIGILMGSFFPKQKMHEIQLTEEL